MPAQAPGDVIAAVRRWFATNGQRPVGSKGKSREEQTLAREWSQLVKTKQTLSAELLAEAEDLLAQFDTDVAPLVAWMNEHKRCPKRHRVAAEDQLAQRWGRYLKRPAPLPPK